MTDKFDRYTKNARRALNFAEEEAILLRHSIVRPEHMFLGLIRVNDSTVAKILKNEGVSLEKARIAVSEVSPQPVNENTGTEKLQLDDLSKAILEIADDEARQQGHHFIGTEHLLLALTSQKEGNLRKVFSKLNLAARGLRNVLIRKRIGHFLSSEPYPTYHIDIQPVISSGPSERREVNDEIVALKTQIEQLKEEQVSDRALPQFEEIIQKLEEITTKEQERELNARIVLPPREDMSVKLVPSHSLERLEEYRGDESIAFLLIGLFGGAIMGVLINWITDEDFVITRQSIVFVSFFLFLTVLCGWWAFQLKKRSGRIRDKLLYNEIFRPEKEDMQIKWCKWKLGQNEIEIT
ncbi:MAG: hypothetical protein KDJ97_18250 [Anaerolineae bacterium]|nr:hypothetical protein [Anaerolineae bacterium]